MANCKRVHALHPLTQARDRDARIIAALERMVEVLRNLAWDAGTAMDLSPLHVQLLGYLHGHGECDALAVDLAARFHLTKPTVSVALRTLESRGLIAQRPLRSDRRAKAIALTAKGRAAAERSAAYLDPLLLLLRAVDQPERPVLYSALFKMIDAARLAGLVRVDRMCVTCAHYAARQGKPYCALMRVRLAPEDHRVDCPEHQAA